MFNYIKQTKKLVSFQYFQLKKFFEIVWTYKLNENN